MIYFFRRGSESLTAETRLNPEGPGYQLLITEHGASRLESFETMATLLSREHELLQAWRAQGWRDVGPNPAPSKPSPGSR